MKMKNKITLLNMLSGLMFQVCTMISGFIIPKIILSYFGSEVNGLVSSLSQFLSYISLAEGGVTGVIIANLYKPIVEKDNLKMSSILVTASRFYKRIGVVFIFYSIVLSIVYPLLFKTGFSHLYVTILSLILAVDLLIQYMFSLSLKSILNADKKSYIINFSQVIITIANMVLAVISVKIYPSIHVLKFISGVLYIFQPILFGRYIKKYYSIDWNAKVDNNLIKERWSGFAINLAAFIHNSTDIAILTIFTNLKMVSVYSVYFLVSNGLKQMIDACLTGIAQTIGQAYAKKDYDEVNSKMDIYEYIVFFLVYLLFTVAALLITSFVQIYTTNITDNDYYHPKFGVLLLISEALYLIKLPHMNLAYSANKFKEITIPSFVEALLNIVVSISCVEKYGLIGVTVGTIVGMSYRTVFHVYYTSKIIPRSQLIFYKKLIIFSAVSIICYIGECYFFPLVNLTVWNWVVNAVIYCFTIGMSYLVVSGIFFKKELRFLLKYIKKG